MIESGETIHGSIKSLAANWSERVALQMHSVGKLRTYTYAQLLEDFQAGGKLLQEAGIKAGDRVALISENSPEWVIAYLAILVAGATAVPMDPKLTPADLAELIRTTEPRAILLSSQLQPKLAPELTFGVPILNIDHDLIADQGKLPQGNPKIPITADRDQAIASIFFTSGTNGKPKGVLLEHRNILHSARCGIDLTEFKEGEQPHRVLCVLPLVHISALIAGLVGPLLMGATITFVEVVRADLIVAAMQQTKTTLMPVVPRLLELFSSEIRTQVAAKGLLTGLVFKGLGWLCRMIRKLTPWNPGLLLFPSVHKAFGGKLRIYFCGGSPLSIEVERFLEQLGFTILKGYGLTETAGALVCNTLHQSRLGHMGKPYQGVEVRISSANPSSQDGEICLRGKSLMRGYFRNPEATVEAMPDGWFHTGDVGRFDSEGNLLATGRLKELIVTGGGKKAAPTAIEEYYQGLPGVKELAVVGVPTAGSGDQIHAAVVLEQEAFPPQVAKVETLRAIEMAVNARAPEVPSYLRIQGVHLLEELPKTTTLKVKRAQLQQQITALIRQNQQDLAESKGQADAATESVDEIAQRVIAIVTQVTPQLEPTRNVAISSTLQFDLAIDSLGWLELAAKVEAAFGIKLDKQIIPTFYTVGDLIEVVRKVTTSEVVDYEQLPTKTSPLVAIQPEGRKPRLYCVHPVAGVVFPYYELSRLLGKEQPLYALQSVGLQNQEQPLTDIKEMAALYIKSLRQLQPHGSYFLSGWSLGAFIAFEMAVQLQQMGESIALLALLDTPALSKHKISNFWQMSRLVLPAVVQDVWPYIYEYLQILNQEKIDNNDAKSSFQLAQIAQVVWSLRQMKAEQQVVFRLLKVLWANSQALNNYTPKVYSGKITLLTTETQLGKPAQDSSWGWSQLATGGVEVHSIPGNHMNILIQPYVQTLALRLEECINRVQQEEVGSKI